MAKHTVTQEDVDKRNLRLPKQQQIETLGCELPSCSKLLHLGVTCERITEDITQTELFFCSRKHVEKYTALVVREVEKLMEEISKV